MSSSGSHQTIYNEASYCARGGGGGEEPCRYLFVYGTLKKGEVNHHHWLAPYIRAPCLSAEGEKRGSSNAVVGNPKEDRATSPVGAARRSALEPSEADDGGGRMCPVPNNNNNKCNSRVGGGTKKHHQCCECFIQPVGTARTTRRYPFFTNIGVGVASSSATATTAAGQGTTTPYSDAKVPFIGVGGSCSPCVVDCPIHDDDLSRTFVPNPPSWQGCAATVDPLLLAKSKANKGQKKEEGGGGGGGSSSGGLASGGRGNAYYNNFPQRVTGELYKVVRCAYCLTKSKNNKKRRENRKGKEVNSSEKTANLFVEEEEEDSSQMMRDFDELEGTRHGVYTRRPITVELLLKSPADAALARAAGAIGCGDDDRTTAKVNGGIISSLIESATINNNPLASPLSPSASGTNGNGGPLTAGAAAAASSPHSASTSSSASALSALASSLSQRLQRGIVNSAATLLAASSSSPMGGGGIAPNAAAGSPLHRHHNLSTSAGGPLAAIATSEGTSESPDAVAYSRLLLPSTVLLTADIYFRTDKYPRSQLVAMLERCAAGPAKGKMGAMVEPLVNPEEETANPLSPPSVSTTTTAAAAGGTDCSSSSSGGAPPRPPPCHHQQQQHIQGFLSNFSAAKSLALSYPTHFSYVAPHIRPAAAAGGGTVRAEAAVGSAATERRAGSDADVSALLRRLPPSVLRSGGRLPPPMVLIVLDGIGDYSGYSLSDGCTHGASSASGHGGHDTLPIRADQTNLSDLLASLTCSGLTQHQHLRFSPLELACLLHSKKQDRDAPKACKETNNDEDGLHVITRSGRSGLMDPTAPGVACGSDTAHLSLLGFDPLVYYRGRGSFETIGSGLAMIDGDVAFKCNFATMAHRPSEAEGEKKTEGGEDGAHNQIGGGSRGGASNDAAAFFACADSTPVVTNRRADRNFTREGPILCEALNGTVVDRDAGGRPFVLPEGRPPVAIPLDVEEGETAELTLKRLFFGDTTTSQTPNTPSSPPSSQHLSYTVLVRYATEHRCGVVIRGPHLSDAITGTDPLVNGKALVWCAPAPSAEALTPSAAAAEADVYGKFRVKIVPSPAAPSAASSLGFSSTSPLVLSFPALLERLQKSSSASSGASDTAVNTFARSFFASLPQQHTSANGAVSTPAGPFCVTIVDPKLGLPLSDAQKSALCAADTTLWAPLHRATLTAAVANAASAAMTKTLMAHDINVKERLPAGKALANVVLLRGAAQLAEGMPTFILRHGLRGAAVAPTAIIKGLAKTAGLHVLGEEQWEPHTEENKEDDECARALTAPIAGITGSYDSDLAQKAAAVTRLFAAQQRTFARLFAAAFFGDSSPSSPPTVTTTSEGHDEEEPSESEAAAIAFASAAVERLVEKVRRSDAATTTLPRRFRNAVQHPPPSRVSPATAPVACVVSAAPLWSNNEQSTSAPHRRQQQQQRRQ